MKFNVSGNEYDIRFKYVANANGRMETECKISRIDPNKVGSERYTPVARGTAMQHHKDQFNKQAGRKVSLTRAAKKWSKSKNTRKTIWDAYLAVCPVK
jgi:hypothetical protein